MTTAHRAELLAGIIDDLNFVTDNGLALIAMDVEKLADRGAEDMDGAPAVPAASPRLAAAPGYERLAAALDEALEQAQAGKGKERHANTGEPFHAQKIVQLGAWLGSTHFEVGQACKKAIESTRLGGDRGRRELLGAINYLAAAVLLIDDGKGG